MREQREDRGIDTAIDRAVCGIMDADTDPAFRARVLARLDQRRTSVRWPWLPLGAVAGAAIVLALLVWSGYQRPTPSTTVAQPQVSSVSPPASEPKPRPEIGGRARVPAPHARQRTSARRTDIRPEIVATLADRSRDAPPAVDVAPLAPVEAIAVAPIVREAIVSSAISVAPLTPIAAVEIEPLSAQTARD